MAYEVRFSPQAIRDLEFLYQEKCVETSDAAAKWYFGLETAILRLDEMPLRGTVPHEEPSLRQILYGKKPHVYRILYVVNVVGESSGIVTIAQIRHGARERLTGG